MRDKKSKPIYKEDDGRTLYPMLDENGRPAEPQKKDTARMNKKERRAAICAGYKAALPMFLCVLAGFTVVFALLYFLMK